MGVSTIAIAPLRLGPTGTVLERRANYAYVEPDPVTPRGGFPKGGAIDYGDTTGSKAKVEVSAPIERWLNVEQPIMGRIRSALEDAIEEGLFNEVDPVRLAAISRFSRRVGEEIGAASAAVYGFMEDGRLEITFGSPSAAIKRITYFVDEAKGQAKRIALSSSEETSVAYVSYP